MSVTELLMRPGRFDVKLRGRPASRWKPARGAPASILSAASLFDHVVITPTRLMPIGGYSDANILSVALYTGVITGRPDRYTISGQGLPFWLATDEGLGDLLDTTVTNTAGTLSTWMASLKPSSLTAGTYTNTGTTLTYTYQWTSRREAMMHMLRMVGAEYRIAPNFVIDAAAPATLFGSTAKGVITRKPEGSEGSMRGFEATDITAGANVDGYTTKTIVVGKTGDGAAVATGNASGANVYKDGLNNNVVFERLVDAPQEPAANVTAYATALQALYGSVRRTIEVDTRTFAVPLDVKPGSYVYVYDPDSNTVDTSVQQQWRGETISPVLLRCRGYTWGLKAGMGVYLRTSAGVYTDISDWVEWENELVTSWELGSSSTDVDQNPDQLGTAFLGVNPNIVARTSGRDWTLPWGVVARGSFTTSTASAVSSGAYIDVGPTLTFTAVAGRVYRASLSVSRAYCAAANLLLAGWHYNGAFSKWLAIQSYTAGADHQINGVIHISGLSAGSQTVKIQASSTGATAVYFQYGTYGTDMIIEDVGPA